MPTLGDMHYSPRAPSLAKDNLCVHKITKSLVLTIAIAFGLGFTAQTSRAEDPAAAKVNGKVLSEGDMKLAEAEIGSELGSLAGIRRRRVLTEFLIETQLLADAAEARKLQVQSSPQNGPYWQRRAMRDAYFEQVIASGVDDKEVRSFFDQHIGSQKPEEEVRARHILVESKEKAEEIYDKLQKGGDFNQLARDNSADPGSKDSGGDLGFFVRGQMVPPFEEAAFTLKPGEVSKPFSTQFGWHIVKVDARRERQAPPYEAIKDRLKAAVIHYKAQQIVLDLRSKAQIEYLDPEIKKLVDGEQAKRGN